MTCEIDEIFPLGQDKYRLVFVGCSGEAAKRVWVDIDYYLSRSGASSGAPTKLLLMECLTLANSPRPVKKGALHKNVKNLVFLFIHEDINPMTASKIRTPFTRSRMKVVHSQNCRCLSV